MSIVTPSDRLSQLQSELRAELSSTGELAGDLFTRAGKFVVEELLKAEVAGALGREPSQRRSGGQAGYRNGYKSRNLLTGQGKIEVDLP